MEYKKKVVTYFTYPLEPHDYRKSEIWQSFWAISEQFLQQHLGGNAQPIGNDLDAADFQIITGTEHIAKLAEHLLKND